MNFCPLKMKMLVASLVMLNETFSVIFKHREVGTRFLESLGETETNFLSTLEVAQASIHLIENAVTASIWHLHQKGDQVYEIPDETGYENLFKHKPTK